MGTRATFTMSRKELPRAWLLRAALAGRIGNAQSARALHLSIRQFQMRISNLNSTDLFACKWLRASATTAIETRSGIHAPPYIP